MLLCMPRLASAFGGSRKEKGYAGRIANLDDLTGMLGSRLCWQVWMLHAAAMYGFICSKLRQLHHTGFLHVMIIW